MPFKVYGTSSLKHPWRKGIQGSVWLEARPGRSARVARSGASRSTRCGVSSTLANAPITSFSAALTERSAPERLHDRGMCPGAVAGTLINGSVSPEVHHARAKASSPRTHARWHSPPGLDDSHVDERQGRHPSRHRAGSWSNRVGPGDWRRTPQTATQTASYQHCHRRLGRARQHDGRSPRELEPSPVRR